MNELIPLSNTITSLEVSEMVEKDHSKLLRDIRNYSEKLAEAKIGLSDFFIEVHIWIVQEELYHVLR